VTDDRVVLPLTAVRRAAVALCWVDCTHPVGKPARHCDVCLIPALTEIDLRRAEVDRTAASQISGDCLDPVKHRSCMGCSCACHMSRRTP
jgi:hypothetical protein